MLDVEDASLSGLRVLAFCDYFGGSSSGGSERVALEVYKRLVRRGAQVQVVTTTDSPETVAGNGRHDITVHQIPSLDLSRVFRAQVAIAPGALGRLPSISRAFSPHVLHANNLYFQTTLAAAIVKSRIGLPLVTTAHIGSLDHLQQPTRWLAKGYEGTIGRFILRRSSRVIAVSESVRSHLLRLGVEPEKIDLIQNGVDLERFRPAERKPPDGDATPLVLFIGRLIANKGPQIAVGALFLLNQLGVPFRAIFLGDGPMRSSLEQRVRSHGLGSHIKFAGYVAEPSAPIRAADIVIRPSFSEGMPLTVLEAMASGVCVLASDIPGNRDLIKDGSNGLLVRPGSASELATAIGRVIDDPRLRRELAAAGHATAQEYSWDKTANRTAAVLAASQIANGR